MKLRDDIRQFGQGMEPRTAAGTSKYGVGYRVVADTHPSGAYHRVSSIAMGAAAFLDLVCYSIGVRVPVLLDRPRMFLWPVAPLLPCGAETSI